MNVVDGKDGVDVDDGADTVMMKRLLFFPRERFQQSNDRLLQSKKERRQPGISLSYLPLTSLRSPVRTILPLLLTLLTLLTISSFARAEWVPIGPFQENFILTGDGNGKIVLLENYVGSDSAVTKYDINILRHDWTLRITPLFPSAYQYDGVSITPQQSVQVFQISPRATISFDSAGSIRRPWLIYDSSAVSAHINDYLDPDPLGNFHVSYWRQNYGYVYLKVTPDGLVEREVLFNTGDSTLGLYNITTPDETGGAYILLIQHSGVNNHYLYHYNGRTNVITGPTNVLSTEGGQNGVFKLLFTLQTRKLLMIYRIWDGSGATTLSYNINPDSLYVQHVSTANFDPVSGGVPAFCAAEDTIWQVGGVNYDSLGYSRRLYTLVKALPSDDSVWYTIDTIWNHQLTSTRQINHDYRLFVRNSDFVVVWGDTGLVRRPNSSIHYQYMPAQNGLSPIYPNPTNGRFSLFLGGRQTNRILVYNLLGQTIASYQPHTGNLVQSILLPGSLPSGTYYLQVQSPTHPTQVLPLHYIK